MRWLVKTEPDSYSLADLIAEGTTEWTGIRNHAAAKYLRAMAKGDIVFIYHSGRQKAVVGTATVARSAVAEGAESWVSVALTDAAPLAHPVSLAAMKAAPPLGGMAMLRQSRLSVSPVSDDEGAAILVLAGAGPESEA